MTDFLRILQDLSFAGAIVSLGAAVSSMIGSYWVSKKKLREAETSSFKNALGSDDLATLGRYLDKNVGAFDISEYVANDVVANRVNQYLAKIQVYLGTDEEVDEEEFVGSPEDGGEAAFQSLPIEWDFPAPFPALFEQLTTGSTWNTLAKLRRHIEIELRKYAIARGFKDKHLRSAGQIIQILSRTREVDINALGRLRYSVSVCNRAIHGRDVSHSEANEAMWNAAHGMLDLLGPVSERPT